MIERNESEIEYVDMTQAIKSDIFTNGDYKEATISNIGRFLEVPNFHEFRAEAIKRLSFESYDEEYVEEANMIKKLKPKF